MGTAPIRPRLDRGMDSPSAPLRRALAHEALTLIDHEYAEDLRLAAVARRLATSSRALQRSLLEVGGTTFRQAIKRRRMEAAAELLRTTDLPIGEIARQVGYKAPEQLSRYFRAHAGVAPTTYRRNGG